MSKLVYWIGTGYVTGVAATVSSAGVDSKHWLYALALPTVALFVALGSKGCASNGAQ